MSDTNGFLPEDELGSYATQESDIEGPSVPNTSDAHYQSLFTSYGIAAGKVVGSVSGMTVYALLLPEFVAPFVAATFMFTGSLDIIPNPGAIAGAALGAEIGSMLDWYVDALSQVEQRINAMPFQQAFGQTTPDAE